LYKKLLILANGKLMDSAAT